MEEVTPEVVQGQAQVPLKDAPRTEVMTVGKWKIQYLMCCGITYALPLMPYH